MKNRIGIHTNYFRGTQWESDLPKIATFIGQQGCNAMELMPDELFCLSKGELSAFRSLTEKLDIQLTVGAGRSPQTDASSFNKDVQEAAFERAKQVINLLIEVGCKNWSGLIHAAWPGHPDGVLTKEKKQAYTENSVQSMKRIAPILEKNEIIANFEVVNRFEHFIFNTAQEGIDFCKQIDSPNFKLLIDTFHMNIEEESICDAIENCQNSGYFGHFHVVEANRTVPGTVKSHIDWAAIFSTIKKVGYDKTIMLEPFIATGCEFSSKTAIWRDLSNGADLEQFKALAAKGFEFVKSNLQ